MTQWGGMHRLNRPPAKITEPRREAMRSLLIPSAVTGLALVLSGCTPPLPPDVLAANAEKTITCEDGTQSVAAPEVFADVVAQMSTSLQGQCPNQGMAIAAPGEPATVTLIDRAPTASEIADFGATCPTGSEVLVSPVFGMAVDLTFNIVGIDTLTLTPAVIAGILSGSITSWDDPAIAALNEGIDLTGLPVTLVRPADPSGTVEAMTTWLDQNAAAQWPAGPVNTLPAGEPAAAGQALDDALYAADGAVTVMPTAEAARNVFGVASVPIQLPEGGELLIAPTNADIVKIGAAATNVTADEAGHLFASPALGGIPVEGQFDAAAAKIVIQEGQPVVGWPVIAMVHVLVCDDPADPMPRLTAQFMTRIAGQGVLDAVGLTPLPEPIRIQTFPALNVVVPSEAPEAP